MAHIRDRYIQSLLKSALKHKGIVGVFGHRQVGKTTVLEQLTKNYVTLDRAKDLESSLNNPDEFLKSHLVSNPLAIDECQMSPPLFPALKEYVRVDKRPGLFLLSGSVRFSSRKAIKESLTGRILTYELLPFSISELKGLPLNVTILDLMKCKGFSGLKKTAWNKNDVSFAEMQRYLQLGGLPGLCFVRNERDRHDLIESQLALILDRDLRLVCETNLPLASLKNLLRTLAQMQNVPLNLSDLSRKIKISLPTLKKILVGLESIFMIRIIPCEGSETKPILFFEDQGEATYLSELRLAGSPPPPSSSVLGMERIFFAHARIPFAYMTGISFQISQYRQQGGAYVPFVLRSGDQCLGVIVTEESQPSLAVSRSADSFLKNNPKSKLIYVHPGKEHTVISEREMVLPLQAVV